MAKPRVFISSTYYDLRNIRADVERFIREQGYESVLFERGQVAYGASEKLEDDCYREISTCDILINIVGGKFGSESKDTRYSISQNELRTALKQGKQVYIFIEKPVYSEFSTWQANKDVKGFIPTAVNDTRVFNFIEEIFSLTGRNPVQPFEISQDIIVFLREQWAGLFQLLIQEHARQKEINLLEKLEATTTTLHQLVDFLTKEKSAGDETINYILLRNHPLVSEIKKILRIPYRVIFEDLKELNAYLNARLTNPIAENEWDSPEYREYKCELFKEPKILKIKVELFDSQGKLIIIKPDEWKDDFVKFDDLPQPPPNPEPTSEEDVPF